MDSCKHSVQVYFTRAAEETEIRAVVSTTIDCCAKHYRAPLSIILSCHLLCDDFKDLSSPRVVKRTHIPILLSAEIMAQSIAPYNNGMRLGQGFNSYTQQICLDHAVLENTPKNWARVKASYTEPIPGQDGSSNSKRNSRSGRRSLGVLHAESPKDEENKGDEKKDDEEK